MKDEADMRQKMGLRIELCTSLALSRNVRCGGNYVSRAEERGEEDTELDVERGKEVEEKGGG